MVVPPVLFFPHILHHFCPCYNGFLQIFLNMFPGKNVYGSKIHMGIIDLFQIVMEAFGLLQKICHANEIGQWGIGTVGDVIYPYADSGVRPEGVEVDHSGFVCGRQNVCKFPRRDHVRFPGNRKRKRQGSWAGALGNSVSFSYCAKRE